jgi:hypothetical protein
LKGNPYGIQNFIPLALDYARRADQPVCRNSGVDRALFLFSRVHECMGIRSQLVAFHSDHYESDLYLFAGMAIQSGWQALLGYIPHSKGKFKKRSAGSIAAPGLSGSCFIPS